MKQSQGCDVFFFNLVAAVIKLKKGKKKKKNVNLNDNFQKKKSSVGGSQKVL